MPVSHRSKQRNALPAFARWSSGRWCRISRRARARFARWRRVDRPEVAYDWFTDAEVAGYDRVVGDDDPAAVDAATWADLDCGAYLRRVGARASIFARQHLYSRLRRGGFAVETSDNPLQSVDDPGTPNVLHATQAGRALLRRQELELTHALFHGEMVHVDPAVRHLRLAPALHLLTLALLASGWPFAALASLSIYLMVYAWAQLGLQGRVRRWQQQRASLQALANAALQFAAAGQRLEHPVLARVAGVHGLARGLASAVAPDLVEASPMLADYANLLTLHEFAALQARVARVHARLADWRVLYQIVAECEARLCLLEHLRKTDRRCWVRDCDARSLRMHAMGNPLLDDAQPLSLELRGKGVLLTGANGVGKSTLLRALGLNLLVARAFGFCYATAAELPLLPVWTSIRNEDSLSAGESLYMAEMRRAEALLRAAESPAGAIVIVDEIFRGTNHLESVAAAAAVLHSLSRDAMVLVSSHHLVLAPLLADRFETLRVSRSVAGLVVEPGVLESPNGLEMMDHYDIDTDVRAKAQRVHDWFAGHVARPADFPVMD